MSDLESGEKSSQAPGLGEFEEAVAVAQPRLSEVLDLAKRYREVLPPLLARLLQQESELADLKKELERLRRENGIAQGSRTERSTSASTKISKILIIAKGLRPKLDNVDGAVDWERTKFEEELASRDKMIKDRNQAIRKLRKAKDDAENKARELEKKLAAKELEFGILLMERNAFEQLALEQIEPENE